MLFLSTLSQPLLLHSPLHSQPTLPFPFPLLPCLLYSNNSLTPFLILIIKLIIMYKASRDEFCRLVAHSPFIMLVDYKTLYSCGSCPTTTLHGFTIITSFPFLLFSLFPTYLNTYTQYYTSKSYNIITNNNNNIININYIIKSIKLVPCSELNP